MFSTISAHDYEVLTVTEGFVRGDPYDSSFEDSGTLLKDIQYNSTGYHRRDIQDCIKDYAQEFVTKNGTVLLVVPSDSNKSYWSDSYWQGSISGLQLCIEDAKDPKTWSDYGIPGGWYITNGCLSDCSIEVEDSTYNITDPEQYTSSLRDYRRAQQELSIGQCRGQLNGSVKARCHESFYARSRDPYEWICHGDPQLLDPLHSSTCADEVSRNLLHLKTWTTSNFCGSYVMYCLGEEVEEECTLRFSLWITLVVILCNMGKLGAMLLVLQTSSHLKPLITIGDAIESFLMKPDPNTEALCRVTRQNIGSQNMVVIEKNFGERGNLGLLARDWQCSTRRWYHSATFGRWRISFLL